MSGRTPSRIATTVYGVGVFVFVGLMPTFSLAATGDHCGDPITLSLPAALPYSDINTTCGRGNNYNNTCLHGSDGGEDIIYEVTVTAAVDVNIMVDPQGTIFSAIAIHDACPVGDPCLAQNRNGGAAVYGIHCLHLVPGTYYIMIDTWPPPNCVTNFELMIEDCYAYDVQCPAGATLEGEPVCYTNYDDNYNGGCTSTPPVFSSIGHGETVCGTSGTYLFAGAYVRDQDWYELVITSTRQVAWTVEAEFDVEIVIWDNGGVPDCAAIIGPLVSDSAGPLQPVTVTACVPAGTWWLSVAPLYNVGVPCGAEYVASAYTSSCGAGACCFLGGACQDLPGSVCLAYGGWPHTGTCATVNCPLPNTGDDCTNPLVINIPADLNYGAYDTTAGRDDYYSDTCLGLFDTGEDMIYELNVSSPVNLDITLDPLGMSWTGIAIDDVCPPGSTCLDSSTQANWDPHGFRCLHLDPGTYYLMVDSAPPVTYIPNFYLTISECLGACCDNYGACLATCTEQYCNTLNGTWYAGENCPAFSCPIPCPEATIDVLILTDDFPGETTWEVVEHDTGIVWGAGGPYIDANTLHTEEVCVPYFGCHDFIIYDSYGDGICCAYGNGYYEVYFQGVIARWNYNFTGSSDTAALIGGNCPGACCHLWHPSGTPRCMVQGEFDCGLVIPPGQFLGVGTNCGQPNGDPHYYESTPPPPGLSIPDNDPLGVTDTIVPGASCEVGDVDVDICIHHPRISDLYITLEHWLAPVVLWDGACGDNDSLGIIFDDEGNAVICCTATVGRVDPLSTGGNPLSGFDGIEVDGLWTLNVVDQVSGEDGFLVHWSLHIDFLEFNPCVLQPRGACCNGSICDVLTRVDCATTGGTFMGDLTVCAPNPCPCDVVCPPGANIENEPCGNTDNDGCLMPPPYYYEPIACGDTVCGTVWADNGMQDTDWYGVQLTTPAVLEWTVEAELEVLIGLVEMIPLGSTNCNDWTGWFDPYAFANACEETTIVTPCLPPGLYMLYVSPQLYHGFPCGTTNDYVATLVCRDCGACCVGDGTCEELTLNDCDMYPNGVWLGPGVPCVPNPCDDVGACCLPPTCGTEWCREITDADCLAWGGTWLGANTSCGSPYVVQHVYHDSPHVLIPDNDPAGVNFMIDPYESCEVGDVDVDLVLHHPRLSDLYIELEHCGVNVVLWDGACPNDGYLSVILDDEGNAVFCATPTMGTVTPRSAGGGWLSAFDGLEVSGPWDLRVADLVAGEDGILYHWSLHIRFLVNNPCVAPRGACCDGPVCTVETQVDCLALPNATYLGDFTLCVPNPCAPPICPGDSNCDGVINWRDIDYFVAAQNDNISAWEAMFLPGTPTCLFENNDVNGDGTVNWRDIDPFVAVMNTTCP